MGRSSSKQHSLFIAAKGEVTKALKGLRESPATTRAKTKFILATDGDTLEAEDLTPR